MSFFKCPDHGSPGTNFLWHIHALLYRPETGHHLGDELACPDGLHAALLLGLVHHHSLHLVMALYRALSCTQCTECTLQYCKDSYIFVSTPLRSTELPGHLLTASHGSVLLHQLLLYTALLHRPLITLLPNQIYIMYLSLCLCLYLTLLCIRQKLQCIFSPRQFHNWLHRLPPDK